MSTDTNNPKAQFQTDSNPRDAHFAGFAKALWKGLLDANGDGYIDTNEWDDPTDTPNYIEVIARRAYDLTYHTLLNASLRDLDSLTTEECVINIPDLTELPEVQS